MPKKYEQKFLEVFQTMNIESRTKDFKPSESQVAIRTLRDKIRLDKLVILLYGEAMVIWREYISALSSDVRRIVAFFKTSVDFLLTFVFYFVAFLSTRIRYFINPVSEFYETGFFVF